MYLKLMNDYEEELRLAGRKIKVNDHFARFDFASWLDRQAAQQPLAQPTGCWACGDKGIIRADGIAINCSVCNPATSR